MNNSTNYIDRTQNTIPNFETQLQNPKNFDFIMDTMSEVMENKIKYESKITFTDNLITRNYLLTKFRIRKHETFACLFLILSLANQIKELPIA